MSVDTEYAHIYLGNKECHGNFCFARSNTPVLLFSSACKMSRFLACYKWANRVIWHGNIERVIMQSKNWSKTAFLTWNGRERNTYGRNFPEASFNVYVFHVCTQGGIKWELEWQDHRIIEKYPLKVEINFINLIQIIHTDLTRCIHEQIVEFLKRICL